MYKTVLYPITVPAGKYCWGWSAVDERTAICDHFDNEGGDPRCTLGFREVKMADEGALKPEECANLKETETK